MDKTQPALLLLPNLLGEQKHHELFLPPSVDKAVSSIDGLIAENESSGRRFLGRFQTKQPQRLIPIALYHQKIPDEQIDFLLQPIHEGERWGFVVDAGIPCIADPGYKLVRRARQTGIVVQAFVGPSSIMLSLMLSGLPGQHFTFHGYLSSDQKQREHQIHQLEKRSKSEQSTQIFIETPYRNRHLLDSLLKTLSDEAWLCVAWELTTSNQGIVSQPVFLWKKSPLPNLDKKNAIFLFKS